MNASSILNTILKPLNRSKNAPIGSPNLEAFFNEVEDTLFKRVNSYYEEIESNQNKKENPIFSKISPLITNLKKSSKVTVPTDKTNSYRAIKFDQYIKWVENYLHSQQQ